MPLPMSSVILTVRQYDDILNGRFNLIGPFHKAPNYSQNQNSIMKHRLTGGQKLHCKYDHKFVFELFFSGTSIIIL